ncbi:unnamed protein product [Prorocentrum cordatum]|uniref:Uncharacterized protein n=1 Tax=Prorocentrum cordatum TaxID=2364126 RepID=A0ABN9QZK6_9DINO|nr:unnamed protein product [Polarella glacialis]
MAEIAKLSPGFREEPGMDAFGLLKRAVTHASGSRCRTPGELMDGLEPKGHTFRFLLEVHERISKRLLRRNVVGVFSGLLQASAWLHALGSDEELLSKLPPDMREPFDRERARQSAAPAPQAPEAAAPAQSAAAPGAPERGARQATAETAFVQEMPAPAPAGSPWGQSFWGSSAEESAPTSPAAPPPPLAASRAASTSPAPLRSQDAIDRARARVEAAAAPPPPTASFVVRSTGADALLEETGIAKILAVKWSSTSGELLDIDAAADAYSSFNKATAKAMASGASPEDRDALERLEPKEAVLEFLAAFSRQSRKHSSRVSATTASLQKCKSWATSLGRHRSLAASVPFGFPTSSPCPTCGPRGTGEPPVCPAACHTRSGLSEAARWRERPGLHQGSPSHEEKGGLATSSEVGVLERAQMRLLRRRDRAERCEVALQ